MRGLLINICLLATLLFLGSCSLTRTVPDNAYLYDGAEVKIKKTDKKASIAQLSTLESTIASQPLPNKRFLGVRWRLRFHNFFHTKKQKGLFHRLQKKWGEPPVLYDTTMIDNVTSLIKNEAFNKGFFDIGVSTEVKKKRKKARIKYILTVRAPYRIQSIATPITDTKIKAHIDAIQSASLIKVGQIYDLDVLKKERDRITADLRQRGYYFFRSDFLKFRADTTRTARKINIELQLKDDINPVHLKPQRLHKIKVYPDINRKAPATLKQDSLIYEGLYLYFQEPHIKPAILRKVISMESGQYYSVTTHRSTIERLSFLKNHQFIDIQFQPVKDADSLLNVMIYLTPRPHHTVEGTLGLSYKVGTYWGPEISVSYLHRNIFKGAEQFRVTLSGNYNYPLLDDLNAFNEQEIELEFIKPGLLLPFREPGWGKNLVAQSKFKSSWFNEAFRIPLADTRDDLEALGFSELVRRLDENPNFAPSVSINNFDFSLSYQWRKKIYIQHELTPLSLVFQNPLYELNEVRNLILLIGLLDTSSEGLQLNLEKMIIIKPGYTFLYDSRLKKLKEHNFRYYSKIAFAGNRLLRDNSLIPNELLESQFFQFEHDIRYYWNFSKKQSLATRLAFNVSVPLQDEVVLPFFDLYEVGGPNSIRAFQPRAVGPGSVVPANESFFFTGKGDVLLQGSVEWRPKLTNLFELGFFVDAGNVWLFQGGVGDNDLATFHLDSFHKQLAIGTGAGIRLNFDILLLRFDLAFPITKPWLPEGERSVIDQIDFGDPVWRRDNLQLQINFGYSF